MDRRRFLLTSLAGAFTAPLGATGLQAGKVFRIGVLGAPSLHVSGEAFRIGLRDYGWIEGENFVFVRRDTDRPEAYRELAAELVAQRPDVIATGLGEPAIEAHKTATKTIPIVMLVSADPVGTGLVASLARSGNNITGMSILAPELGGKRLEFLKQAVPHATRVAVLWNAAYPGKAAELRDTEVAGARLKVGVQSIELRGGTDVARALSMIGSGRVDALITLSDPLTLMNLRQIVALTIGHHIPLVSEVREFADGGALMTYGANLAESMRRAAGHVDRILKGARPSDLPIEQPTRFELVINLKTAKALGLTIPPPLLARADQVIE
jgi:putative tryptophan/tyrosine transport system substrate-binding protein